jgi:cell wall-associated NlpC family hydrolase
LQVVPAGQGPKTASAGHYDDSQYNLPSDSIQPDTRQQQARVQLISTSSTTVATATATTTMLQGLPAPSQVLHAVTKRFADDDGECRSCCRSNAKLTPKPADVAAKQANVSLDRIRSPKKVVSAAKKRWTSPYVDQGRATRRSDLKMQGISLLHGMIDPKTPDKSS